MPEEGCLEVSPPDNEKGGDPSGSPPLVVEEHPALGARRREDLLSAGQKAERIRFGLESGHKRRDLPLSDGIGVDDLESHSRRQ